MLLLILESLGSTELLLILVMALVFFGPRKLPQLSRSIGKSLAEFRRASDDFKRTWEREVAMESESTRSQSVSEPGMLEDDLNTDHLPEPQVSAFPDEQAVPRERSIMAGSDPAASVSDTNVSDSSSKRDWL